MKILQLFLPFQQFLILVADPLYIITKGYLLTLVKPQDLVAHISHLLQGVRNKYGRSTTADHFTHLRFALFSKRAITY